MFHQNNGNSPICDVINMKGNDQTQKLAKFEQIKL